MIMINDFAYAKITYDGYVAPSFLEVAEGTFNLSEKA